VIVPVFKTGERQAILSLVGSTPTRFRHLFPSACSQELDRGPPHHHSEEKRRSRTPGDCRGVADTDFGAAMMALFTVLASSAAGRFSMLWADIQGKEDTTPAPPGQHVIFFAIARKIASKIEVFE
jgi:hypothetical protein